MFKFSLFTTLVWRRSFKKTCFLDYLRFFKNCVELPLTRPILLMLECKFYWFPAPSLLFWTGGWVGGWLGRWLTRLVVGQLEELKIRLTQFNINWNCQFKLGWSKIVQTPFLAINILHLKMHSLLHISKCVCHCKKSNLSNLPDFSQLFGKTRTP